jgi:hypothetical protein
MNDLQLLLHDHKVAMWWITVVSGIVFFGSLILVPWLVVRVPADYFANPRRPRTPLADDHPLLRWIGLVIKNLAGVSLVLAGIAMIFLPGQGLLTIAIGVLLMDFPGKHNLEGKIIRIGPVLRSINWLRNKANVPPLVLQSNVSDTNDLFLGS